MAEDIKQQIADGARPLARVGDVIEHGQDIPANVVRMLDVEADYWLRVPEGWQVQGSGDLPKVLPHRDYWPMTVAEVDPVAQPAEPAVSGLCEVGPDRIRCVITHADHRRIYHLGRPYTPQPERDVEDDVHYYVPELHPGATFCGIGIEEDDNLSTTSEGGKATCDTCRAEIGEDAVAPQPAASDPGTFADCVAWLIDAGLGGNADRRVDRMAAQHQELQARYGTVVSDRETVKASLELVKQRTREQPAVPGPLVLTLPVVPDGAVALVGNRTGNRYEPDGVNWESEAWAGTYPGLLWHERPEGVTVEMAPLREPRSWPKLDPTPGIGDLPDVVAVMRPDGDAWHWKRRTDAGFQTRYGRPGHAALTLAELRELGEVREVLT